jgi:uncharacterized protein (DUF302 family)
MALVLLVAGRGSQRDELEEGHLRPRTRITLTSKYDVEETARQIERSARMSGLPVLVRTAVQPTGEAPAAGAAQVLVLGSEDGRTPVVQADGGARPHLPWQVTIRRLADGRAEVTLPDARSLAVPDDVDEQTLARLHELPRLVERRIT